MNSLQKLIDLDRSSATIGYDWPNVESIIDQAISECDEIRQAIRLREGEDRILEEIGDLLHACVSLCVYENLDVDQAIRNTAKKFSSRLQSLQQIMREQGYTTLNGQSFDFLLELWHEAKIRAKTIQQSPHATLRSLNENDIPKIVDVFTSLDWYKPFAIYKSYLQEQKDGKRMVWVAFVDERFVGYVTLKWQSSYQPFQKNRIPEINDLNVVPAFQGKGIGSQLLNAAEQKAKERSSIVGIGVGLSADYGRAQQIYVNRGYVPDGRGVTYKNEFIKAGNSVKINDDLVLWLLKKIN